MAAVVEQFKRESERQQGLPSSAASGAHAQALCQLEFQFQQHNNGESCSSMENGKMRVAVAGLNASHGKRDTPPTRRRASSYH